MRNSWCSDFVRASVSGVALVVGLTAITLAQAPVRTPGSPQAPNPPSPEAAESSLAQAARAEFDMRLDVAGARLYELLMEHPGERDVPTARLRLARLLALAGKLPQALLQCQLLRDDPATPPPLRGQALDVGTVFARRLRSGLMPGVPYFSTVEPAPARGVQALDEPRAIVFDARGGYVMLDEGARRVYRVGAGAATVLPPPQDPSAVAILPDGTAVIAGKTGLAVESASRAVPMSGAWGGKTRQVKKVRSMAALSDGSLLVVDNDYDGVLRCQLPAGSCSPWGPPGKFRVVRVGPTDWVYLLDDRGQSVRVLDAARRPIAVIGPLFSGTKLEDVEDLAVDAAHGFYLLDTKTRRILIGHVQAPADGTLGAVLSGSVTVPQAGERAVKDPSAIGVAPDGGVLVAGKSSAHVMRFR